jgi:hypothetical protein
MAGNKSKEVLVEGIEDKTVAWCAVHTFFHWLSENDKSSTNSIKCLHFRYAN